MVTTFTTNGGSTFKIRRPSITTTGFVGDVDVTVDRQLDEIDTLLGRRIFRLVDDETFEVFDAAVGGEPGKVAKRAGPTTEKAVEEPRAKERGLARPGSLPRTEPPLERVLVAPLTPKRVPGEDWASSSLATIFSNSPEYPENKTLAEIIDMVPKLSNLKYTIQSTLADNRSHLDANTRAVLDGHAGIADYLVAYAYSRQEHWDVNGLKSFMLQGRDGVRKFASYAVVSAARTIIDQELLKVPDYNHDNSDFVTSLKSAALPLSAASFKPALKKLINSFVFDTDESVLIDKATLGKLPVGIKPQLIRLIQKSPVPITKENINFFLPTFISQITGSMETLDAAAAPVDPEVSDRDFDVQFLTDDASMIQVSRSNVLCAAQLYYVKVLGEELDVFNTVNFFTHKYLIRGGIDIQDSRLREDLQMYVFSDNFINLKVNKIADRTRPAERQMFYRQVFGEMQSRTETGEDLIVNPEYPRLWKVLMFESAKYLERARESFHPDNFVSRQNVMQAVEDLQYNLSTHCTGMANVIAPLIYAELDFVIRRILMHPEVLRQVVPVGSTWWRVVEKLQMEMRRMRPKATVLYNKAKLGHQILRSVADYNPATFDEDGTFSAFISQVDAFITTQSILQEALESDLVNGDESERPRLMHEEPREYEPAAAAAPAEGSTAGDEWDF